MTSPIAASFSCICAFRARIFVTSGSRKMTNVQRRAATHQIESSFLSPVPERLRDCNFTFSKLFYRRKSLDVSLGHLRVSAVSSMMLFDVDGAMPSLTQMQPSRSLAMSSYIVFCLTRVRARRAVSQCCFFAMDTMRSRGRRRAQLRRLSRVPPHGVSTGRCPHLLTE